MAEFQEVMKQAKRMCGSRNGCTSCPLVNFDQALCKLCREVVAQFSPTITSMAEDAIMSWAAKNPEPRYPTWKEWQDTNFPNNDALMQPCIFESEEYFNCKEENGCEECMNKPIPAEIAEKLGIKPIGGDAK